MEAACLLRKNNIEVVGIGKKFKNSLRLTPKILSTYDAVVTIGKTVQYAIANSCPVYCYDYLGGPGWLTTSNFLEAEKYNFSGRCCNRKRSAQNIVSTITEEYETGLKNIGRLREMRLKQYNLSVYVEKILSEMILNTDLKVLSPYDVGCILSEANMAELIAYYYRKVSSKRKKSSFFSKWWSRLLKVDFSLRH